MYDIVSYFKHRKLGRSRYDTQLARRSIRIEGARIDVRFHPDLPWFVPGYIRGRMSNILRTFATTKIGHTCDCAYDCESHKNTIKPQFLSMMFDVSCRDISEHQ